jgi:hypothetical protein
MDNTDRGVRYTLHPQSNGRVHVLLEGVVLGMELAPFMEALTELVAQLCLDPANIIWFERFDQTWSLLTTAWRDGRCTRVEWTPLKAESAEVMVKGVKAVPVMA